MYEGHIVTIIINFMGHSYLKVAIVDCTTFIFFKNEIIKYI